MPDDCSYSEVSSSIPRSRMHSDADLITANQGSIGNLLVMSQTSHPNIAGCHSVVLMTTYQMDFMMQDETDLLCHYLCMRKICTLTLDQWFNEGKGTWSC
ncbi:hypothetical protein ACH5RR_033199 [Cinchona calisaya]|uniref:Uncharacterized protein n=1 Tax=Cinchona calisaya TaxID=153742 RepID=A0ABD2YNE8_9GENT